MLRLFKIPIEISWSWVLILVLVAWSLATGFFPSYCKDCHFTHTYLWIMGVVGALGMFASIVLHELSHSLVARKYGVPIKKITLFIFGGVAEIAEEPPNPNVEFRMAIAGPAFSLLLSGTLFLFYSWGSYQNWAKEVQGVLYYLAWANSVLALFNLIPAFPLDGGRILRSALWSRKRDLVDSTRIACKAGSIFGAILIGLGLIAFLGGSLISGIWYFFIGMFMREAASSSFRQVVMTKTLEGETVQRFMKSNPVTVPADITLDEFADKYLLKYQFKMFPVLDDGKVVGSFSTQELKKIPKVEWSMETVARHLQPISENNSVSSNMEARDAFLLMNRTGRSRLLVMDQDKLVGVVTLRDVLQYMTFMFDLEAA